MGEPTTAYEAYDGTGSNEELLAILTSHGVITDPDEIRAHDLRVTLINWRNASSKGVAEKYQAVRSELSARLAAESADAAAGSYAGRAEAAEAALATLEGTRVWLSDTATRLLAEREAAIAYAREAEAKRAAATARAEQAEAALAELRERLGETREEWGVSWNEMAGKDPLDYDHEAAARASAANLCADAPHGVTGVQVMHRWAGTWRPADNEGGCLCPHTQQPDGTLTRDGVLAVGCPMHDPDAGAGGGGDDG